LEITQGATDSAVLQRAAAAAVLNAFLALAWLSCLVKCFCKVQAVHATTFNMACTADAFSLHP
jgi:hypothetical protein